MDNPYFAQPPPKSLDRMAFDMATLVALSAADGAATLTAFTAHSDSAGFGAVSRHADPAYFMRWRAAQ